MIEVTAGIAIEQLPAAAQDMAKVLFPSAMKRFTVPGIVGAGLGLVGGGAMPVDEDDDDAWLHQLRNAGIGTVLGGLGGLGVGAFRRYGAGVPFGVVKDPDNIDVFQPTHSLLARILKRPIEHRVLPASGTSFADPVVRQYLKEQTAG